MTSTEHLADNWDTHLATLRELAQVVRDGNLSELEVEHDGVQISIKAPSSLRLQNANFQSANAPQFAPLYDDIEYSNESETSPQNAASSIPKAATGTPVVSPMVGLFYRAPSPSDPNFVEVGDRVEIGQTLALVETMKVFNEITSELEGTVLEIRATSGALVETGDTIMVIG